MFFRKKKDVTKVAISLDQLGLIRLGICFAEKEFSSLAENVDPAFERDRLDLVKTRLALGSIMRNGCGIIEVKS